MKNIKYKVKRWLVNNYYRLWMILEDFFSDIVTSINSHRKKIDEKYWDKYLK